MADTRMADAMSAENFLSPSLLERVFSRKGSAKTRNKMPAGITATPRNARFPGKYLNIW